MSGKRPEGFSDLADLPEDQRIEIIGTYVLQHGKTVGVVVEDSQPKIDRYVKKVRDRFPAIALIDVTKGPVDGTSLIRFGPQ